MPASVWGQALPGEQVTVEFAGQRKGVAAGPDGKWLVRLDSLEASAEGRELLVFSAESRIRVRDVLVGEVWLASGQSNMASPVSSLRDAEKQLSQAADGQLRFFTAVKRTSVEPLGETQGKWEISGPESAKGFSAAAYFFARDLRRSLNCPVAVLHASWGGTPIETWISLDGFRLEPALPKPLRQWELALEHYRKVLAEPKLAADYLSELQRWKKEVEPAFSAAMKVYNAAIAEGRPAGEKPKPAWPEPTNPDPMGIPSPSRRPQTPSVSFNGMIAPLVPFTLRGILWYQGEANGAAGLEYRALLPRLIQDWRRLWHSEFPFLYVQLPANGKDPLPVAESGWPWLREAQFMTLKVAGTAMAITIDVGDPNNVHPADKLDVGHRLALLARRAVYGEKLVASGPLFREARVEGSGIRIQFGETGSGLTPGQAPWRAPGVETLPTDRLVGFFICGEDRKWVAAETAIEGETVLVSSPSIQKPVAVRYGWANSPRCNLYNKEGLPASPFRTDDWPK